MIVTDPQRPYRTVSVYTDQGDQRDEVFMPLGHQLRADQGSEMLEWARRQSLESRAKPLRRASVPVTMGWLSAVAKGQTASTAADGGTDLKVLARNTDTRKPKKRVGVPFVAAVRMPDDMTRAGLETTKAGPESSAGSESYTTTRAGPESVGSPVLGRVLRPHGLQLGEADPFAPPATVGKVGRVRTTTADMAASRTEGFFSELRCETILEIGASKGTRARISQAKRHLKCLERGGANLTKTNELQRHIDNCELALSLSPSDFSSTCLERRCLATENTATVGCEVSVDSGVKAFGARGH